MAGNSLTLDAVEPHTSLRVMTITDAATRESLRTMGITRGSRLRCLKKLAGGPLVVRSGGVTLALGRELASTIVVAPVDEEGEGEDP